MIDYDDNVESLSSDIVNPYLFLNEKFSLFFNNKCDKERTQICEITEMEFRYDLFKKIKTN